MIYLTLSSVLIELLIWRSYANLFARTILCDDERYLLLSTYLFTNDM